MQTELHKLAGSDKINQENIQLHIKDINIANIDNYFLIWDMRPLHVALYHKKRKAVLFLIGFGADINMSVYDKTNSYTVVSFIEKWQRNGIEIDREFLDIITGGKDNAKDLLISEGLLDEDREEKHVKLLDTELKKASTWKKR